MTQSPESKRAAAVLLEELQGFARFAEKKLHTGGYDSIEELLGLWRANHPVARSAADAKSKTGKSAGAAKSKPQSGGVPYL